MLMVAVACLSIIVGVLSTLIAVIYRNVGKRIDDHEALDNRRFEQIEHSTKVRHDELLAESRRVSKSQLMMFMAMIANDGDAKDKLIDNIQGMLG